MSENEVDYPGDDVLDRDIPNSNEIVQFMACNLCYAELPEGKSPQDYAHFAVGFTPIGLQVWCSRHNVNVIHIDFQGASPFPANTGRPKTDADRAAEQTARKEKH